MYIGSEHSSKCSAESGQVIPLLIREAGRWLFFACHSARDGQLCSRAPKQHATSSFHNRAAAAKRCNKTYVWYYYHFEIEYSKDPCVQGSELDRERGAAAAEAAAAKQAPR